MESMSLEEFAEQVRRKAGHIMGACAGGQSERAGALAAELCSMAAQMKMQAQLHAQQDNENRYDLATLPVSSPFDE